MRESAPRGPCACRGSHRREPLPTDSAGQPTTAADVCGGERLSARLLQTCPDPLSVPGGQGVAGSNPAVPTRRRRSERFRTSGPGPLSIFGSHCGSHRPERIPAPSRRSCPWPPRPLVRRTADCPGSSSGGRLLGSLFQPCRSASGVGCIPGSSVGSSTTYC
jgi:hypothetical protein